MMDRNQDSHEGACWMRVASRRYREYLLGAAVVRWMPSCVWLLGAKARVDC